MMKLVILFSVHWAGTELAREWLGYIEGAIESADRAVVEVLEDWSKERIVPAHIPPPNIFKKSSGECIVHK